MWNDVLLVDHTPRRKTELIKGTHKSLVPDFRRRERIERRILNLIYERIFRRIVGSERSCQDYAPATSIVGAGATACGETAAWARRVR